MKNQNKPNDKMKLSQTAKWSGKTWTAAKNLGILYMQDPDARESNLQAASIKPSLRFCYCCYLFLREKSCCFPLAVLLPAYLPGEILIWQISFVRSRKIVSSTIGSGVKIENYAACMLIPTSKKLFLL